MNWLDFFLYLALFYLVYYSVNILIDIIKRPQSLMVAGGESYSFQSNFEEEDEKPTVVVDDEPIIESPAVRPGLNKPSEEWENADEDSEEIKINEENPVKSTGGITSLNALFTLGREDAIEMKKKIIF